MVDTHDNAHAATMRASAAVKVRATFAKGAVLGIGTEETPEAKSGMSDHVADFLARQNGGA